MKTNQTSTIRIGIPTTLFASYHLAYWYQFITSSGFEAVLSDASTEKTVIAGGRLIPHEFCIPIKLFVGHIQNLLEKEVNQILIPRMVSKGNSNFFCPKLIGLPEIITNCVGLKQHRIFSPHMVGNGLEIKIIQFPDAGRKLTKQMKSAAAKADLTWRAIVAACRHRQVTLSEAIFGHSATPYGAHLKIALLGYSYNLYDSFINKGILGKLSRLGVKIYTSEMLDPAVIESGLSQLKRPLFWNFGKMVLGAGLHFLEDPEIDGVIYLTAFGCGPDSVSTHIINLEASALQKPILHLNLDEHSETGHIHTRLEAFIDMLIAVKEDHAL